MDIQEATKKALDFAATILEQNVRDDPTDTINPACFLVDGRTGDLVCVELGITKESKCAAFRGVSVGAREREALAVIVICDTYARNKQGEQRECLLAAVIQPDGAVSLALERFYR